METRNENRTSSNRSKPDYRVWLVQDRTDGRKPDWTELAGVWPLKTGNNGYSGRADTPVALREGKLMGRIVILPPKEQPNG
jgi:hypothetical protein